MSVVPIIWSVGEKPAKQILGNIFQKSMLLAVEICAHFFGVAESEVKLILLEKGFFL